MSVFSFYLLKDKYDQIFVETVKVLKNYRNEYIDLFFKPTLYQQFHLLQFLEFRIHNCSALEMEII